MKCHIVLSRICHFMQIVSYLGNNLHEVSSPRKKKNKKKKISLSSAEFVHSLVSVNKKFIGVIFVLIPRMLITSLAGDKCMLFSYVLEKMGFDITLA